MASEGRGASRGDPGEGSLLRRVASSFAAGPLSAPFVTVYIVASWLIFLPQAEPAGSWGYETPGDELATWLYAIPDLYEDTGAALLAMVTAPWVHRSTVQLVFVSMALLIFGTRLEHREGTARTAIIFFSATTIAAVTAAALLHLVYPDVIQTSALDTAWERTWGGGSAGTFGVIGALVGRAQRPWPLIGLVVLWEGSFALLVYQDYVPALHIPAFICGFVATRYLFRGPRNETSSSLLGCLRGW